MSVNNNISVDVTEKYTEGGKTDSNCETRKIKCADFETAIAAARFGKFQYLLFIAIIPVSWASSIDTANMSMILPSAECDLKMTLFHKGVLNAVVYVGMVTSGFAWGYLADVYGRKNILVYGFLADGICNILSGFSQDFWTLAFFKFLSGLTISGPYASIMAYCSEFYGVKVRARILLLVGFSVAGGCIVNAALAWMIIPQDWSIVLWDGAFVYNSWRMYLSSCGVATLFGVICLCFFPESPKFLMSQGRNKEALNVFKLMYKMNTGKSGDDYPIHDLEDETMAQPANNGQISNHTEGKRFRDGINQIKAIFFFPHLPRLILVTAMQFGGMLAMNTIRLWQPQLFTILENFNSDNANLTLEHEPTFCEILDQSSTLTNQAQNEILAIASEEVSICTKAVIADSVYMNTIIVSSTTNLCILLAGASMSLLNPQKLLFICYGVSFLCLLAMNWSASALLTLTLACSFVGLMSTAINIVIGTAVILFPTSLRAMAVSLEMICGRTGTMIGNLLFPVLIAYGCLAPIIALSVFVTICLIATCFLPVAKKNEQ